MKNSKKLSNLIALAVLFGGVTLSRPAWAEEPVFDMYFHGNQDYSDVAGGTDLSGVTAGIHLAIVDSSEATITFGGNSFTLDDWQTQGKPGRSGEYSDSHLRAIYLESGDVSNAKLTITGGTFGWNGDTTRISGGYTLGGSVENSTIEISGGTISSVYRVFASCLSHGMSTNNRTTISGGTITCLATGGSIIGGLSSYGGAVGNSTLEISGGNLSAVQSLTGGSGYEVDYAVNNKLSISDGTVEGLSSGMYVRGGYSQNTGFADNNTIEISGGTLTNVLEVYAGYGSTVSASNNQLTITGGNIEGISDGMSIYGGRIANYGVGENNTITISGGTLSNVSKMAAAVGSSNGPELINNKVSIKDGIIEGVSVSGVYIYGSYTSSGLGFASDNTLEISGGTLSNVRYLAGNFQASSAEATNNGKVSITGGTISGVDVGIDIRGIYGSGTDDNGMVEIKGGKLTNVNGVYGSSAGSKILNSTVSITDSEIVGKEKNFKIYGGFGGYAENNKLEISDSTLSIVSVLFGGQGSTGAINNQLSINGGTIEGREASICGGLSGEGITENNIVKISSIGTMTNVTCVYGAQGINSVANNSISIIDSNIEGRAGGMTICGGYENGSGSAINNTVEIKNSTLSNVVNLYGAFQKSGTEDVTNNKLLITGGSIQLLGNTACLYGGYGVGGLVANNMLEINGCVLNNVYRLVGGYDNMSGGVATNNTVLITDGNITGRSTGVEICAGLSASGNAVGNTVSILGGTLNGKVAVSGGFSNAGAITGNKVIIGNNVNLSGATVNLAGSTGSSTNLQDNTLTVYKNNVDTNGTNVVNTVQKFQKYEFEAPADMTNTLTMLKVNNTALVLAATDVITVNLAAVPTEAIGTLTLIDSTKGITDNGSTKKVVRGNNEYAGTFDIVDGSVKNEKLLRLTAVGALTKYIDVLPDGITGNVVNVTGGTTATINDVATPAFNNGGDTTKTKWQNVYGGYSEANGAVVSGNSVTVAGDYVKQGVYGGYSLTGDAKNNTVTVSGGTFAGVYGGYSLGGEVSGNIVNIQGGEITGDVYAGKSAGENVTNNTINWSAGTIKGSEIRANNINITGTAAQYLGTAGTMTADGNVVLGDGATFTVGDGADVSALTFGSGLDDKATSVLQIAANSSVIFQGVSTLEGTVTGAGKVVVDGAVTADADKFTQTGGLEVKDNTDVLTLTGTDKTVGQTISGAGKVVIDGTLNADMEKFTQTGGLGVKDSGDVLNLTAGELNKAITNNGTVKLSGATLGGKYVTAGTLEFAADLATDASYVAATTNIVDDDVELALTGGTLGGAISGAGKVVINGTVSADANRFTQTGGLEVKDNDDTLTLTAGELTKAITNNGKVEMKGAKLGAGVTGGLLDFVSSTTATDASYVAASINRVNSGKTLTLEAGTLAGEISGVGSVAITGEVNADADKFTQTGGVQVVGGTLNLTGQDKVLEQKVSGAGKVVIDGTISADADRFTQTGGLEVRKTLNFTAKRMNMTNLGEFTQIDGSNVVVPVEVIEADTNKFSKAMFTGVDEAGKLNVGAGNLTVDGPVTDGKYYVLVAGEAVSDGLVTVADLWNKDNITLDFSKYSADKYLLLDFDYVTGDYSIALKVEAVTVEEGNTSGLAAVQQGALAVSKEFTGEVENHLGMIANPKLVEKEKYDKEVWASYIRTKETTDGMKLGKGVEGNNTAKYNGAVVGVDFYSSKKSIAGLALGYITGDVDSYSGTTATKNDAKYYGVSFYDRVTNGNTALIYDIGYIRGNNDVSQYYNGKAMTSDVKTNTYTAGARWETAIETGKSRVVPFAAFRYMRVNNGDYTNSHNTRFEAKNQNLYIPKVGIAWTGDFVASNSVCTWRPSVEVGYLWNLGDRSAESNVLVGTRITDIGYDVADKSSFYGKAGIELMSKNFTAGVFYRYLKGNAVKNNKWNVNMSWSF